MEYIANNFGLELPSFATTRRHYIMKVQTRSLAMMMDLELERLWMLQEEEEELTTTHARATTTTTTCLDIPPISSLVLEDIPSSPQMHRYKKAMDVSNKNNTNDDQTLETINTDEEDESSSSISSSVSSVTFADPLVTEVRYRPVVATIEEKELLFYSDKDYQAFRRDFMRKQRALFRAQRQLQRQMQQQQRRRRKVHFPQDNVVTGVFEYVHPGQTPHEKERLFYSERDLERFLDDFVTSLNGVIGLAQPKEAA